MDTISEDELIEWYSEEIQSEYGYDISESDIIDNLISDGSFDEWIQEKIASGNLYYIKDIDVYVDL